MARKRTGRVKVLKSGRIQALIGKECLGTFDTADEAWLRIRTALAMDSGKGPLTVRVYGEGNLQARDEAGTHKSIADDWSRWRTHVANSFLANMEVKAVRPQHIVRLLAQLAKKPALGPRRSGSGKKRKTVYIKLRDRSGQIRTLSAETMGHVRSLLSSAVFEPARLDGKITNNPCDGVPLPRTRATVIEDDDAWSFITAAEIRALFEVLPDLRHKAFFAVAIYSGLRDGEILGLRWSDCVFDATGGTIKVRKQRSGSLKAIASRRDVPMFPVLRELLLQWKAQTALARKARGDNAARPFDVVFPNAKGGAYSRGYNMNFESRKERRVVRVPAAEAGGKRIVRRSGEPIVTDGWRAKAKIRDYVTFHDLRHTCASHLVMGTWTAQPLKPMEVKAWLGHASLKTTMRYAHLAPGHLRDAIASGDPDRWILDATIPAPRVA